MTRAVQHVRWLNVSSTYAGGQPPWMTTALLPAWSFILSNVSEAPHVSLRPRVCKLRHGLPFCHRYQVCMKISDQEEASWILCIFSYLLSLETSWTHVFVCERLGPLGALYEHGLISGGIDASTCMPRVSNCHSLSGV